MAIRPSTMSRFRACTRFMSVAVEPVTIPKRSAWWTRSATFALQISCLLGRQLVFGQEPPINLRSTTAERCPDLAMCQATNLPPSPLPRTSISKCSAWDITNSPFLEVVEPPADRDFLGRRLRDDRIAGQAAWTSLLQKPIARGRLPQKLAVRNGVLWHG